MTENDVPSPDFLDPSSDREQAARSLEPLPNLVRRLLKAGVDPSALEAFARQLGSAPALGLANLRQVIERGAEQSKAVQDAIGQTVRLLHLSLEAAESSAEREQIREQLLALVAHARNEATEHRTFLMRLGGVAASAVVVALGVTAAVVSNQRSSSRGAPDRW